MSERTVAEIIGWEPAGTFWVSDPENTWEADIWDVGGTLTHLPPTVDDLLAWIHEREGGFEMNNFLGDWTVSFGWEAFHGDTLLEALTAAVRAIDAQEGTNG